ncbi:hypothetical protein NMG60_11015272 [Bertholletia excelsa]
MLYTSSFGTRIVVSVPRITTMASLGFAVPRLPGASTTVDRRPHLMHRNLIPQHRGLSLAIAASASGVVNSTPPRRVYRVGDFMTRKEHLLALKTTTSVDEALATLVDERTTGFPVVDDDWKLVGVVSDYDLLALASVSALSGGRQADANMFPDVNSSWNTFLEIQRLLRKTNGKVVGDLMTAAPLVVRETTNLEDAVRLLLETKHRRLPVVDGDGRLVGIITRRNVVRATRQIRRATQRLP